MVFIFIFLVPGKDLPVSGRSLLYLTAFSEHIAETGHIAHETPEFGARSHFAGSVYDLTLFLGRKLGEVFESARVLGERAPEPKRDLRFITFLHIFQHLFI